LWRSPIAELLLLDEPSSGLDPLVRRDILEAIIRSWPRKAEPSLLVASLDEVERVSDTGMIHQGRVVFCGHLDK